MQGQEPETRGVPQRQIGFFCHVSQEGRHAGAILVTNQIGVPLEFKYTEPIAINRLQRILYGAVLDRYIHETLLRDALGRELRSQPRFFITGFDEKEFLGTLAGREMMALQEVKAPAVEPAGPAPRPREREALVEVDGGTRLRIAFSTPDPAVQQEMAAWIREMGRTMDLLEPMERMKTRIDPAPIPGTDCGK